MIKASIFSLFLMWSLDAFSLNFPALNSYPSNTEIIINDIKKNKVLIFLNRTCPCTQQNLPYLNELAKKFPEIEFIGVHSVRSGTEKDILEIIETYKPIFTLIDDHELKIADLLKANRTPQAFILNIKNEILYSGGVTDRTNPQHATKTYLKNALEEIMAKKAITEKESRSLGCVILR